MAGIGFSVGLAEENVGSSTPSPSRSTELT
jgi:hypothetical protein